MTDSRDICHCLKELAFTVVILDLFMYLMGVPRGTQEYFTYAMVKT